MELPTEKIKALESRIGYTFKDKTILLLALTHPSLTQKSNDPNLHYQRLEFLGDSLLSFFLTDRLFHLYPEAREGALASYRSTLEQGSFLAYLARTLDLPHYIILSEAEAHSGGSQKDSILEDVLEALIAAIYQDSNLATAQSIVLSWYGNIEGHLNKLLLQQNPKGQLQELIRESSPDATLQYRLIKSSGPDHNKQFTISLSLNEKQIAQGEGSSKKIAEEAAARQALVKLINPKVRTHRSKFCD